MYQGSAIAMAVEQRELALVRRDNKQKREHDKECGNENVRVWYE